MRKSLLRYRAVCYVWRFGACRKNQRTAGRVFVGGLDACRDRERIRSQRALGLCPQFDALYELLTVDEHVALYATLLGYPASALTAGHVCRRGQGGRPCCKKVRLLAVKTRIPYILVG